MKVLMLALAAILISCATNPPAVPKDDHSGREAVITHDYNGDGVDDVYAIKCNALPNGEWCSPGRAWTCGVVIIDGMTGVTLYQRGFCLHRVPDMFGARDDTHEPVIKIGDAWYGITEENNDANKPK